MRKRLVVMLMALVYVVALSAGISSAASDTKIDALYEQPEIRIKLPTRAAFIFNPNGAAPSENLTAYVNASDSQIINTPWTVENHSECAVEVDVSAVGTASSGLTLAKGTPKNTSKQAYLFLESQVVENRSVDTTKLSWASAFNAKNHILVQSTAPKAARKSWVKLEKATGAADSETNEREVGKNGIAAFHLGGKLSKPESGANWSWASSDKVTVKVSFTFRPATSSNTTT